MTTTVNGHRRPPQNLEAEEGVLGCCLLGPEALTWAVDHLESDQFCRPEHRTIFAVLAELRRDGQPVDVKVLASVLTERRLLDGIGGLPFLNRLFEEASPPANVGWFGRRVIATARLRRLIDAGMAITLLGYEDSDAPDRALAAARSLLEELEPAEGLRLAGPTEIMHAMLEVRDADDQGSRVTWGLPDLDRLTKGLPPRQLIVLGARPSQGKSSLALQVALETAQGHRALFGSWEMGLPEIGQHHLAALGGVSVDDALTYVADDRLAVARRDYTGRQFLVLEGRPDVARFCAQVRGVHARQPLDLVVVDYLQMVDSGSRYERRDLELGAMAKASKDLAVGCDLPVLLLSSMTRADDEKNPSMRHLRDSGQIEHHADIVVLLAAQSPEDEDDRRQQEAEEWRVVDAIVAKNRMGRLGRVRLRFDEPRTVFQSLQPWS